MTLYHASKKGVIEMVKENDIITDGTTKWKVRRLGGSSDGNPVGTIIMYAANNMPEGYLLCDGSAVSRTNYAELFKVIGTTWGAGDGSTTFNLPNAVGRFPEGAATAGGYIEAGLPEIFGYLQNWGDRGDSFQTASGRFYAFSYGNSNDGNRPFYATKAQYMDNVEKRIQLPSADFKASRSSATYGKSTTNQPAAFTVKYFIKYIL